MRNLAKWLPSLRNPDPPRLWRIGYALALCLFVAVVGLILLWHAAFALLHNPQFPRSKAISLHDAVGVAQLVFASVAGAGALVALVVAYRRQRVAEATAALDRERWYITSAHDRVRLLNERFAAIAAQLGDSNSAVRLAGVHAMAGLADDWVENQQTCIDVLCAYLRMPYEPGPGPDAPVADQIAFLAAREVRHTVIRVITAHLREDAAVLWRGLDFDFTGVTFDGGDFSDAVFSGGTVSFRRAGFSGGTVDFHGARFSGGTLDFHDARFSGGTVDFHGARFSGATVEFDLAEFSGATVGFRGVEFSGGTVSFRRAEFSGGTVDFGWWLSHGAVFSGATVDFGYALFCGAEVGFQRAVFSGGTVDFGWSFGGGAKFSAGVVDFSSTKFSGGTVRFRLTEFSGGTVDFHGAEFSGGTVDFSTAQDWSHPPKFDWQGAPPTGVKVPATSSGASP